LSSAIFPYTTLFRSHAAVGLPLAGQGGGRGGVSAAGSQQLEPPCVDRGGTYSWMSTSPLTVPQRWLFRTCRPLVRAQLNHSLKRSEEHTSELQSRSE